MTETNMVNQIIPARSNGRAPTTELLEEVVRRIVEVAQPEKILLFGSAALGHMGPNSDVDLLVIKRGVLNRRVLATEIRRALRGLREAFDIIVATPEDIERYGDCRALLYWQALREGKTLFVS